jgi:hypothetical protein
MYLTLAAAALLGLFVVVCWLQRYLNQRNQATTMTAWGPIAPPSDMIGAKGCFLGACGIYGEGAFPDGKDAHAHLGDRLTGWVCFRNQQAFENKRLRQHELAHILSGQPGHDDRWMKYMIELDQSIPLRYRIPQRK